MSEICQEVNQENFEPLFVEHSKQFPVLVVFYAQSYPESMELVATIEKAALNYKDKMIFSKVNCEVYPQFAQQFNVKNLPTVVVVKDAKPVDGFAESATVEKISQFIEMQFPKQWEIDFEKALLFIEESKFEEALPLISDVFEKSEKRHDVKMHYVHCLLELNQIPQAQSLLNEIGFVEQDEHYHQLMALLDVKLQAQDSPEIQALKTQFEKSPDDIEILKTYAAKLGELGKHEEALELLYSFMSANKQETSVRPLYLDIIKMSNPTLAAQYQRKLYALLY